MYLVPAYQDMCCLRRNNRRTRTRTPGCIADFYSSSGGMSSIRPDKEDTNMPRATVQRSGANNTAFFFVGSRKVFAHVLHRKIHAGIIFQISVILSDDLPEKVGNSA